MRHRLWLLILVWISITNVQAQCDCTPAQAQADSLNLLTFYAAFSGNLDDWGTTTPLSEWEGIQRLTEDGCVLCLDLDGWNPEFPDEPNNLNCNFCQVFTQQHPPGISPITMNGNWPTDLQLPCLGNLSLDRVPLNIPLPNFAENFPALCELYLRDAGLSGSIDPNYLVLPDMILLNLNDNSLSGEIPEELPNGFGNLIDLFLDNNNLEGLIPDFYGPNPQLVTFSIVDNQFTFEDLLPNYASNISGPFTTSGFRYAPQDSIYQDTQLTLGKGLPFTLDLLIDDTVTTSTYRWFKDGLSIPSLNTTDNVLHFDTLMDSDAGIYHGTVTNSIVSGLTLYTRAIEISTCEPNLLEIDTTLCPGQLLALLGDLSFDKDTIHIFRSTNPEVCDSAIIAQVAYHPDYGIGGLDTIVCSGTVFTIDNQEFTLPGDYQVTLPMANVDGCDSLLDLTLTFADPAFGAAQITAPPRVCSPTVRLIGNQPENSVGNWITPSVVNVNNISDNEIEVAQLQPGAQSFGWVLGAGGCTAYDSVFVEVYYEPKPRAEADAAVIFDYWEAPPFIEMDLLDNDTGFLYFDDWRMYLLEEPSIGDFELDDNTGRLTYFRQPCFRGELSFRYVLESNMCPGDTATVTLDIRPKFRAGEEPPNVITPNGDGKNDVLIVPAIFYDPSAFPGNVLSIFHINGQLVYRKENYDNNWGGTDMRDRVLPGGDYRLVFDYGNGQIYQGSLTIIRSP